MSCKTKADADNEILDLADMIDDEIKGKDLVKREYYPDYILENPDLVKPINCAEILFKDIDDIHSEEGLEMIAQRYMDNKDILEIV